MNPRSKAREYTVQAIYQWIMTQHSADEIEQQFIVSHDMDNVDFPYFQDVLHGSVVHQPSLADVVIDFLSRPFSQIDPVEQAILLLACYELQYKKEVPYRVIINEAIELSKTFGAEDGHRFINGILDKVAEKIRAEEVKKRK